MEEISLRRQFGSAPDVLNNAMANELGSEKVSLEDNYKLTIVVNDENMHTEKSVLVSRHNNGNICASSGGVQLGSKHPSGKTLFDNTIRNDIKKETKSGLTTEMEYSPREP